MSRKDWRLLIEDILEAVSDIQEMTDGMDFEGFVSNKPVRLGALYSVAVIGEAARHVPTDVQARYPDVPWRLMSDMRNVLVHNYAGVDLRIVWGVLQNRLPSLESRLRKILTAERDAGV